MDPYPANRDASTALGPGACGCFKQLRALKQIQNALFTDPPPRLACFVLSHLAALLASLHPRIFI
jgi:hypothetical protein